MERVGIYVGAFDPPQKGNLRVAKQAMEQEGLARLLLIPGGSAASGSSVTQETRLALLRLAVGSDGGPEVPDPSEGMDVIRIPEAPLFLDGEIFRDEEFRETWMPRLKGRKIRVFCGDRREAAAVDRLGEELVSRGISVERISGSEMPLPSVQMRRLLAFRCAGEFLPEQVLEKIREDRLYDTRADWKKLPMEELEKIVVRLLDPGRVNHVLGCRNTAVALARRWGADTEDAARAGILHDITKAIDGPLQLTLCAAYGKILSDFSRKYPKTLHALTGSLVAQRIFGENEQVVQAICFHTTGRADMTLLEKIIYVADYMEPGRDFPGVERLRELADTNLDGAVKLGLEMTLEHLKDQGAEVSPESRDALAWLNRQRETCNTDNPKG